MESQHLLNMFKPNLAGELASIALQEMQEAQEGLTQEGLTQEINQMDMSYEDLEMTKLVCQVRDLYSKYDPVQVAKAVNTLRNTISIQYLSVETKKYVYRDLQKFSKIKEILDMGAGFR